MSVRKRRLDKDWFVERDPLNIGKFDNWQSRGPSQDAKPVQVPGVMQEAFPGYHGVAWYWNEYRFDHAPTSDQKCRIWFGAVDYYAEVWLNGVYLGHHEGGETAFQLDGSEAFKPFAVNLLAVRVINPTHEAIDGFTLNETPHYWKKLPYEVGGAFNHGGIVLPVEMRFVPAAVIEDIAVIPQCDTGTVRLKMVLRNDLSATVEAGVTAVIGGSDSDGMTAEDESAVTLFLPPGTTEADMELKVDRPRLWGLDDPFLYAVSVGLEVRREEAERTIRDYRTVRCGFRDFRVDDEGYFRLNGQKIFVKSSHTTNHFPIGQRVPYQPELMNRDLLYAKAAGFNMIRFIAGMPYPEQLDFCDTIGLLVYEECYAAWDLRDSPKMAERYVRSTGQMVQRDRNHPSVVIWGLLNERLSGPVFDQAVATLPFLRKYDPTRLVLLSSGRWDGQYDIGSVSNPGTVDWQRVWGEEQAQASPIDTGPLVDGWFKPGIPGGYIESTGGCPHLRASAS
ncbi:hypothetical protein OMP38_10760 [Cohnella ginsengisoli]|uniref:Beta-galactosidase n=1 Tax=Cohnella ginsengisoli TaxID=425004 RepID=A0A9X4QMG0_9BACL|nr:glycoside hydrolase family 2 TIM barrel-domain containing protein [Cohnella ginsengisoli]MDG0791301.1 hypothetical protein [Cohnella ginsengisoli]